MVILGRIGPINQGKKPTITTIQARPAYRIQCKTIGSIILRASDIDVRVPWDEPQQTETASGRASHSANSIDGRTSPIIGPPDTSIIAVGDIVILGCDSFVGVGVEAAIDDAAPRSDRRPDLTTGSRLPAVIKNVPIGWINREGHIVSSLRSRRRRCHLRPVITPSVDR